MKISLKPFTSKISSAVAACIVFTSTSSYADDDWDEFEDEVKKELRSKDVEKQISALGGFVTHDHEEGGEFLVKFTYKERKNASVADAAGKILGKFKNPETRELIQKYVTRSPGACLPLLSAYFAQPGPDTQDFALKIVGKSGSKSPELTQAVMHLGNYPSDDPKILAKLATMLVDKSFHSVRRATADALGGMKNIQAVPVLIPYVGDLVIDTRAQDALYRLTGQQFKKDQKAWTAWWEKNKATASASGISKEDADKKREEMVAQQEKQDKENGVNAESFYGEPITGKSILFILDRSGSMSNDGRMDKMKEELKYMIASINENRSFGFVLFPHDAYPGKGVSKANESFKRRATSYVEKLEPTGTTPISEAMEHAFKRVVVKNNVDTIYLLSDGAPNKPAAEVRALINGLNGGYYVQIHTVSIGADSQFLKDVAADNEGNYRAVK